MYANASKNADNQSASSHHQTQNSGRQTLQRESNGKDSEALSQLVTGRPNRRIAGLGNGNSPSGQLGLLMQRSAVQPTLKVSKPDDRFEQEADQQADQVMAASSSGLQRQAVEEEDEALQTVSLLQRQAREEEEELQAKIGLQRQAAEEEEEIQARIGLQRQAAEEEEEIQARIGLQRQAAEEEEEIQARIGLQRQDEEEEAEIQARIGLQRQDEEEEAEIQAKFWLQRQAEEEEEMLQTRTRLQRQAEEEEEMLQTRTGLQRQAEEEEEMLQTRTGLQRQAEEEEEMLQTRTGLQRQAEEEEEMLQTRTGLQRQPEEEEEMLQTRTTVQRQVEEEAEALQTRTGIFPKKKDKAGIKFVVNINEPKKPPEEVVQSKAQDPEEDPEQPVQAKSNVLWRVDRKLSAAISRRRSASSSAQGSASTGNIESSLSNSKGAGFPLAGGTRNFMESQLGADFSGVRLHTDSRAAEMSNQINAQAFTHGSDIYFNEGKYNPDTSDGKHLLAHELTHTIQQGASIQQKPARKAVQQKSTAARHGIQRSWLGDAWDSVSGAVSGAVDFVADQLAEAVNWVKDQFTDFVQEIPGYKLLSVVLGQNPITGAPVARSGMNFIEAGLDIIPFGSLFKRKLEETGALQEAATWLDGQIANLDVSLTTILSELSEFWDDLSITDVASPSAVLNRAANIIRRPIGQIITFAGNVATEFLRIVKNYVIRELATFVRDNTRGYPLLTVILAQDPITEEPVERNGMNLIRGFMLLSDDGEEQLRQMEETGSLQQAADWIDGAVARLDLSWETIRNIFSRAWDLISIENLISPLDTFQQLVGLFADPVGRIIRFVIEVGLKILEYIKKALLSRLSAFARETRGYPLITVILGKDPFTDERVVRTPENIIRGFMSLMDGGEEQFQQLKESGAIQRTTDWIEGAVARLGFTWEYITGLFITAWESFSLQDLAAPFEAFGRIVSLFADPIRRLFAFIWEVLKKVIEIVLIIMKFPIGLVSNIITKAMQAIEDIKRDPVGFIKNLLRAIKQGFSRFFDNILTHLINGLTSWLFSELEDAGVRPPRDLSLGSIFEFVLDVLGVSIDRIWQKLGDRIGHDRVARIRGMMDQLTGIWTFVRDVIDRGPVAIWDYIVEKLSNLWDMVLEHVQNWVMGQIVRKVTAKLLSMLDPTGIMAVVNSVIALYNAIESFIRYITEMLEIVNSFVEGVAEIARGTVSRAAEFLENSLARAMPVAIGFLANQAGLSGLGRRIGEMIEAVREKVDLALDWLIDKAVSAGTAFLNMARAGAAAVRGGIASLREWWTSSERVETKDGKGHEIKFAGSGSGANLIIESSPGQAYITYLDEIKTEHNLTDDQIKPAKDKAGEIDTEKQKTVPDDKKEEHGQNIHNLVIQLADITRNLPLSSTTGTSTPPVYGPLTTGYGSSVSINRLTSDHGPGTGTPGTGPRWQTLRRRKEGGDTLFVQGHLLNQDLGGPGEWNNLTPLTQAANLKDSDSHYHGFEKHVKKAVDDDKKPVNFTVTAGYGRSFNSSLHQYFVNQSNPDDTLRAEIVEAEQYVPNFLECQSYEVNPDGSNKELIKQHTVHNTLIQTKDSYPLSAAAPKVTVYLNEMSRSELMGLTGIGKKLADDIIGNRPFRTKSQLQEKVHIAEGRWNQMQSTPGKSVRIYRA